MRRRLGRSRDEVKLGVWVKVTCTYTHIRAMDGTAYYLMLLRLFLFGIF